MMSPACIVVLCFALATLTFGAPNGDFANFDVAPVKPSLEDPGHKAAIRGSPVEDSGPKIKAPQVTGSKDTEEAGVKTPDVAVSKGTEEAGVKKPDGAVSKGTEEAGVKKPDGAVSKGTEEAGVKKPDGATSKDTQAAASKDPPAPKKVVYEFGTPSKYDVQISPDKPHIEEPKKEPFDYAASAKFTDPKSRKITYVRIEVFQTGEGSANIVEGAIGTSVVSVAIAAKGSLSYRHDAKFYTSTLQSNIFPIGNSTEKDIILARVKGTKEQYSSNQKIVKVVKYPGTTDKLKARKPTYVVVTSKQTSPKLTAEVTKGDLKKSKDPLEVTLTADETMELDYEVVFYSSAARSQPLFFTAAVSLLVFLWSRFA